MHCRYRISVGASVALGLIFAIAGLGKLLWHVETFKIFYTLEQTPLTPTLASVVSVWLPPLEVILGLLLVLGVATRLAAVASSIFIVGFMANNGWLLSQGLGQEPCECFGVLEIVLRGSLSTTGALYLDIGMLALALTIIFSYPGSLLTTRFWFLGTGQSITEDTPDENKGDSEHA